VCASHCAQLLHTILHRTDLIVFPLTLQTITTAPMMSIWGKGWTAHSQNISVVLSQLIFMIFTIHKPIHRMYNPREMPQTKRKVNEHSGFSECSRTISREMDFCRSRLKCELASGRLSSEGLVGFTGGAGRPRDTHTPNNTAKWHHNNAVTIGCKPR